MLQGARDETGAAWRPVWSSLAELGMFGVAVAEEAGGAGGTLADLAAILEQAGYELIPGPVVTTSIGALLCSAAQVPPPLVDAIVTGRQPVAICAPQPTRSSGSALTDAATSPVPSRACTVRARNP